MKMKQIQKMMKQAQQMQQQLEEQMASLSIEGSSGGGMVKVTVDGKKNLLGVVIDPEAVDPCDVDLLQDMIVAAVNDAGRKVDETLNAQMGGLAGGLTGM